jgi:hypothetical protein
MATRNGNAPRGSALPGSVAERLPHRSRSFNIANLPNDIREQLNLRLLEGETGWELAAWLNALPEVQSILNSQFNGSNVSAFPSHPFPQRVASNRLMEFFPLASWGFRTIRNPSLRRTPKWHHHLDSL